ncbi:MAG: peptidoglycan DD-metalloendopeptidase family protein [Candidatus Aquicultor sp.]|nr:peptidoglycan DD-metalloendopeptidase family protein [Candidatus Aquicultor sp.]
MGGKKTVLILPILVVVLVLLGVPMAAGAAVVDKQEEIERIQEEIANNQASLDKATLFYQQSLTEVRVIDDRIRENEAEVNKTKAKIETLRKNFDKRVIYMYKAGPSSFLSVLVFSDDFTDFLSRAKLLSYILYCDYDLISKSKELRASLDKQGRELAASRTKYARQLATAESLRRELYQQYSIKNTKLAQLNNESGGIGSVRFAMARTDGASRSYVSRGQSRTGFAFPVAGPNSYVDSWGAGRSGGRRHKGTDIMSSRGTPVVACVSGTISKSTPYDRGLGGITIYLDGDNGDTYYYAHLNGISAGISSGARVEAGQVIGSVGSSGNASASAPHLHFEIHRGGGSAVNPYATLRSAE